MNLSFDELLDIKLNRITTASKFEQRIQEAPSLATIVTRDEIKQFGYRNLADVLASESGFYTTYDRNYQFLGVRGFARPGDYNSRVLVLINGHRINDNIYGTGAIGNELPIDIDMVERVEIIRGPSSSIYGNNAFFGVVNVIPRQGLSLNTFEVSAEAASWDTYKGAIRYGKSINEDLEVAWSSSFTDSLGPKYLYYKEFDNPLTHNGIAVRCDTEQYFVNWFSIRYKEVTLETAYNYRQKGIPTAPWGGDFNDPRTETIDERPYLALKFRHEFPNDWELATKSSIDYYSSAGNYPTLGVINRDEAHGAWIGQEIQVSKSFIDRFKMITGVELRKHLQQDQANYDIAPQTTYIDARYHPFDYGLFAQLETKILTNLLLNLGGRYDKADTYGDSLNPRLGLIYSPFSSSTIKLLYGKAFRAPNAYEAYYTGIGYKLNPGLKPENVDTYELVLEQNITKQWKVYTSGYYYEVRDLISQVTDPTDNLLIFKNLERVNAKGLELGIYGKIVERGSFHANYSIQRAEDSLTGIELNNSPRHLGKIHFQIPIYKTYIIPGFGMRYRSSLKTLAGNRTKDQAVFDFTLLSAEWIKGLELSANIYNLFNNRIENPGSIEHLQDILELGGRSFRFAITYRF